MLSFDVYFIDWTPSHLRAWMADRAASKEEEVLKFKGFFFLLYYLFLRACVFLTVSYFEYIYSLALSDVYVVVKFRDQSNLK